MIKSDVILIGSGISALTAALFLAKKGKTVTVLEQYTKPGGYLHCFSRFGERYDTGAHYVGAMDPGNPFHTILSYLDVFEEDTFIRLDPNGFDVFNFPEFQIQMVRGYENAVQSLAAKFPKEEKGIREYFRRVEEATTYFPTYRFSDGHAEIPAAKIFETSLETVVTSLVQDPALQCVLYAYCTLHGVQPKDVPFGFHALMVDSLLRGPFGFRQGGDRLAEQMVAKLESLGSQCLLRKRATRLGVKDKQVHEVETADGDIYQAEWVISAIHPKTTFALCDDKSAFPQMYMKRVENIEESVGILGISAICKGQNFDPLRNYYFFNSSDPAKLLPQASVSDVPAAVFLSSARREVKPGEDLPINVHSAAPIQWFNDWRENKHYLRDKAYKQFKHDLSERTFAGIEKYQPGFRESVTHFAASTPLTNLRYNGSVDGSAYGLYHSIENTGPRGLGPRTRVLNLLLTGQNTLFPGLLGATISGLRTSGHILGIKSLLGELKEFGSPS